jgi:hypothetical protein
MKTTDQLPFTAVPNLIEVAPARTVRECAGGLASLEAMGPRWWRSSTPPVFAT